MSRTCATALTAAGGLAIAAFVRPMPARHSLAFVLVACGPTSTSPPGPGEITGPCVEGDCNPPGFCVDDECWYDDEGNGGGIIQLVTNRDVDVLFVIDNSASMGHVQARLAAAMPAFVDALEGGGWVASYRIGVTTTDNGNPECADTSPEAGVLSLTSCRARLDEFVSDELDATAIACTDRCIHDALATTPTATGYDGEELPRPWIEGSPGRSNLAEIDGVTPSIVEALQCLVPQGIGGCDYASPLASMHKALLRSDEELDPQYGFLRSNAVLAVVIVADDVDCSYQDASIFATDMPTPAICWRAGTSCVGDGGTYESCGARDDGVLRPVADYVHYLQAIEDAQKWFTIDQQVVVQLISGVPHGYASGDAELVYADATSDAEQTQLGIGAGCIDPSVAPPIAPRPPVREREVAEAFEIDGARNLWSMCDGDYAPALTSLAAAIRAEMRPTCMPTCVADNDSSTPAPDPICTLQQESPRPDGGVQTTLVGACVRDGSLPAGEDVCWVALGDPAGAHWTPELDDDMSSECTELGWNLEFRIVRRPGVPAAPGTTISATCAESRDEANDCPGRPQ